MLHQENLLTKYKPAVSSQKASRAYASPDLFREDTILWIEQLYRDAAEHQRKIRELLQKVKRKQTLSNRPEKTDNSRRRPWDEKEFGP